MPTQHEEPQRSTVKWAVAGAVIVGSLLLGGCAGQSASQPSEPAVSPVAPTASASVDVEPVVAVKAPTDIQHVHNLGFAGDDLLLGTHEGLYRQAPGREPQLVSEPFDVMGFSNGAKRWLASGHPGPGMAAPADLGLLASSDEGRTWDSVSLSGEVDFHRLTTSGSSILGVNSGDGLLWRSGDAGKSWETVAVSLYDVALDPADPDTAVATTPEGLRRSTDGGKTWSPIADTPLIALLAWHDDALVGVTPEGRIHSSTDGGRTWDKNGSVTGTPVAVAAHADHVAVLADDTVWQSNDAGESFSPRMTGLGGH